MSTNFTIANGSWSSGHTSDVQDPYRDFLISLIIIDTKIAVVGTLVNLWFIVALLLSPDIRARMRNKIICIMLAVNLTEAMIACPLSVARIAADILGIVNRFVCFLLSVGNTIYHIQDFLNNWYLVILLCINMAHVMNFEPKFTPLWINIFTFAMFTAPCVIAVLFVPLTVNSYYYLELFHGCVMNPGKSFKFYKSVDTIVPLTLASLLLLVTSVLKYRRYPQGRSSDTLRAQLIDDGAQIEPLYKFVIILAVAVMSDFCVALIAMDYSLIANLQFETQLDVYTAFTTLAYLRTIFMPVVFLLFGDIRERIKTWRPWRRSALRADLVVTYEKNTS